MGTCGQQLLSQVDSPLTTEMVKLLRHTLNSDVGIWNSPASLKEVSRGQDEERAAPDNGFLGESHQILRNRKNDQVNIVFRSCLVSEP